MRIYGVFRGFPGLGRVVAGISILSSLKENGHEVKAYSYLQGIQALRDHDIALMMDEQPTQHQISAIGLNPIGEVAEKLIDKICSEAPDMVIVDGEALLISTLSTVYPREKILALLNPADLFNESQPLSTREFYHRNYLAARNAIVHGVNTYKQIKPEIVCDCDILQTNTILRQSIIELKKSEQTDIVAILGGGCSNSSESFWKSTLEMGSRVVEAAKILRGETFTIYCNDYEIAEKLSYSDIPRNVSIIADYTLPEQVYSSAKVVLCRAGRNTISEILYLGLPAILMSSSGDYRSVEQERNIDQACAGCPNTLFRSNKDESGEVLAEKVKKAMEAKPSEFIFEPGNEEATEFVLEKVTKYNGM